VHGIRPIALAALLAACGASQPTGAPNGAQPPDAVDEAGPAGVWKITLRVERAPASVDDQPPALNATLHVAPPEREAEEIALGQLEGGEVAPEPRGLLSVTTYFAGAGEQLYLERDGDRLAVYRRAVGEAASEPSEVAAVELPGDAEVHYLLRAPGGARHALAGCPAGATTVFQCEVDGGLAYLCLLPDRIRLGGVQAAAPTPEVFEVPRAHASRVLQWYRPPTDSDAEYQAAIVTVVDVRYAFIDERMQTEHRASVRAGYQQPHGQPIIQCDPDAETNFEPLRDLVEPLDQSPPL
jgi:hypothetical protein